MSVCPQQKRLAAAGEQDAGIVGVDRLPRRPDPRDREVPVIQRRGLVAGRILDRQAGDAGFRRACDILCNALRLDGKAALEVGVDGNIDGGADRREVIADIVDRDAVVGLAHRPRETGARGCDRLESEMLQRLGGAGVERIRNHEAAAFMQLAKIGALVSSWPRHRSLPCCRRAAEDSHAASKPEPCATLPDSATSMFRFSSKHENGNCRYGRA